MFTIKLCNHSNILLKAIEIKKALVLQGLFLFGDQRCPGNFGLIQGLFEFDEEPNQSENLNSRLYSISTGVFSLD